MFLNEKKVGISFGLEKTASLKIAIKTKNKSIKKIASIFFIVFFSILIFVLYKLDLIDMKYLIAGYTAMLLSLLVRYYKLKVL